MLYLSVFALSIAAATSSLAALVAVVAFVKDRRRGDGWYQAPNVHPLHPGVKGRRA